MGSSPPGSKEQEEFSARSCVIFECGGHKSHTGNCDSAVEWGGTAKDSWRK